MLLLVLALSLLLFPVPARGDVITSWFKIYTLETFLGNIVKEVMDPAVAVCFAAFWRQCQVK